MLDFADESSTTPLLLDLASNLATHTMEPRSGQQLADWARLRYGRVRQAVVAAVVGIGQFAVIETQLKKQSGVEIINADHILHRFVAELVSSSMHIALLKTATRKPE